MVIGDCSQFAIEYELEQSYGGVWLFGKLGNYDLGTSLRDMFLQMYDIVRDSGDRVIDEMFTLNVIEIFERLDGVFYGPHDFQFDKIALEENWSRFNVKINICL